MKLSLKKRKDVSMSVYQDVDDVIRKYKDLVLGIWCEVSNKEITIAKKMGKCVSITAK